MKNDDDYTIEDFFNTLVVVYLAKTKSGKSCREKNYNNIYKMEVRRIQDKIEKDPSKAEYYSEILKMLDTFYKVISDPSVQEKIVKEDMRAPDFISLYGEMISGKDKRKYDMSDMFHSEYIASSVDSKTREKRKAVIYKPEEHIKHEYQYDDKKVTIEEVGKLGMKDSINSEVDALSKYKVQIQIGNHQYLVYDIYSNISFFNMDEPQYKQAILEELLSQNNLTKSNAEGYVGEIVDASLVTWPEGSKETKNELEYFYKINDKYALRYGAKELTATMLYEQGTKGSKNKEDNQTEQKPVLDNEER